MSGDDTVEAVASTPMAAATCFVKAEKGGVLGTMLQQAGINHSEWLNHAKVIWGVLLLIGIAGLSDISAEGQGSVDMSSGGNCGLRDALPEILIEGPVEQVYRQLQESMRTRGWEVLSRADHRDAMLFVRSEPDQFLGVVRSAELKRYILVTLSEDEKRHTSLAFFVAEHVPRYNEGTSFAAIEVDWFIEDYEEMLRQIRARVIASETNGLHP